MVSSGNNGSPRKDGKESGNSEYWKFILMSIYIAKNYVLCKSMNIHLYYVNFCIILFYLHTVEILVSFMKVIKLIWSMSARKFVHAV